ncbi:uncharacterized protein LOC117167503 isoform X1 [Belonocnema kinseyi]|uniref:uncharacterized protein LOC117167503 isoform X1 n=1 Tax=Belonocnema kinseyi TaxID=2817044 RepID=UPI00143D8FF1|nr:uncharacterized protein LOC117167503 isoform X1 [Belonocnema kinseyi]
MSKGDGAMNTTRAKETEDFFPVRDIETDSRELVTLRTLAPRRSSQSARNYSQNSIDFSLNFERLTFSEMGEKLFKISQITYLNTSYEAINAIRDIKYAWVVTTGKQSEKMKVTSRLVMYYLIIFSLYIIKSCTWVDRKLLAGLLKMLLESKKNTQMLIGLGIVLSLIVVAYVIGTPCPEPQAVCDK